MHKGPIWGVPGGSRGGPPRGGGKFPDFGGGGKSGNFREIPAPPDFREKRPILGVFRPDWGRPYVRLWCPRTVGSEGTPEISRESEPPRALWIATSVQRKGG